MLFTHRQNRSRPAGGSGEGRPSVRPALESLESREAPVTLGPFTFTPPLATGVSFGPIVSAYSLFPLQQQETVVVNVAHLATGGTPPLAVNEGSVTITDAGQTQTVPVNSNGVAAATFTFAFNLFAPFFGEQPQSHGITASYSDPTGSTNFSSSSGSTNAPDTTNLGFSAQIGTYFWAGVSLYLYLAFTGAFAAAGSGGGGGSGGSGSSSGG